MQELREQRGQVGCAPDHSLGDVIPSGSRAGGRRAPELARELLSLADVVLDYLVAGGDAVGDAGRPPPVGPGRPSRRTAGCTIRRPGGRARRRTALRLAGREHTGERSLRLGARQIGATRARRPIAASRIGHLGRLGSVGAARFVGALRLRLRHGWSYPTMSASGGDCDRACAASRPDMTAASTHPSLNPQSVQSPAIVRLSKLRSSGEIR